MEVFFYFIWTLIKSSYVKVRVEESICHLFGPVGQLRSIKILLFFLDCYGSREIVLYRKCSIKFIHFQMEPRGYYNMTH